MAKRYTIFRLIPLFALLACTTQVWANGDPVGNPVGNPVKIKPTNLDSLTKIMGHCNPIVQASINCQTKTIILRAFVDFLFSGTREPIVAEWNTGEIAHIITVVPPGMWSWDPSGTGCEPNHWDNEFSADGPFFDGPLEITGPLGICPNESFELNVNNPDGSVFQNVMWGPPVNSDELPLTIDQPGTYTLSLEDEFGCPFSDQIVIPASPVVAPGINAPVAMCPENDTSTLQILPLFNHYLWDNGDTINPLLITAPGTYSVTVTNQFGCTGTQSVTVNSAEVPPINITMTAPAICPGQNDILTGPPGFISYEWSNGDLGITNIVTQPGTYEVTVTNQYGCTGTGSATVDALPTPTIAITTTPFCPGGSSSLNVTGGNFPQYTWSSGQTTNPINVSNAGTYSVTVSGSTLCATSTSVVVTQLPAPTTVIAQPSELNCSFPQTNLNAVGSSADSNFTFVWTTAGGNFVSGQNTLTPTVNAVGTYTLQITNINTGCTSSASVTVTSNTQPPPAPAGPPGTLTCTVTSLNIGPALPPDTTSVPLWTASGGGNIVSGQNTWNPTINQPGTYTVTSTNPANGCTATGSVTINQNTALPTSSIDQPALLTCTMNSVALNGSGSSSGPNFSYQWSTTNGTFQGPTNTINTVAGSVGTYTLLVTNNINGCTAVSSTTVAADLNIPITGADPAETLTCTVQSIVINATASSSGPTFTYTWTGPSPGSIIAGQGTLQPTVNAPGVYTLQLVNTANSCSATLSVNVPQDIAPPVANAGPDNTLNCVIPLLQLDGSASSTGPNFSYQWTTGDGNISNGATGLTPTVTMAGTYDLLVTNTSNGCTATSSVQVLNDANAPAAAIANPATLTCTTLQTILDGLGSTQSPTNTYTWSGPAGGIISGQGTLQPTVNLPGVYTLDIVNTVNGCTATESITVPQDIVAPVALAGPDGLINCYTPASSVGSTSNPSGANFSLVWSTLDGNITSPTNGPTANIDAAGTYTLVITNTTNGCTDTDEVVVTDDFAIPAAVAGPTFELNCIQTTTVLQGSGATGTGITYSWTTNDGTIDAGANTLNPTVSEEGTYNLLVTNTINGCTATDLVLITVSADVPVSTIAQPALLTCTLTSFNLNAAGSSVSPTITYNWTASNGGNITGGGTTLTPSINEPGTYTLLITDSSNSCTDTETITVAENVINPEVTAGLDNTLTCVITNLPLQATTLSSSSPNITYQWSTMNGTIIGASNVPSPTIGSTGIYTVVITDQSNGCTDTDDVQIFADVAPPVAAIAQPAILTCTLQQTPIDATGSSPLAGFTFQWTTSNGNIVSGVNSNQPIVDDPGTYNVLITSNTNGCTQTASIVVDEDVVLPTAVAGPSVGLDCDTQVNGLNGSNSSQGPNFTYLWTTTNGQIISGVNTLTPQIGDPGTYVLTVNNNTNGCVSTSSVAVTEDVVLPVSLIAPPQLLTCITTTTPLDGSGNNFGSAPTYSWSTTNGNIVGSTNTLDVVADAPGTYTLTVVNTVNGCTDTEQVVVTENVNPPVVSAGPVGPLTCTVLERILQANASAQAILLWSTLDGNIVSGANTANPVVDEPGTYTVLATLPINGCTASTSTPVLQEQNIPTGLEFLLDPPLCNGTLGLLTVEQINGGVGPFQYSIDGGATYFPAQDIDGLQPGTYDLVIRDANGCEITQNVPVPAPPTPAVDLPASFSIVLGDQQDLQAIVPPAFPIALIDEVIWEPMTGLTFAGSSIAELLNPVAMPFVTTEYKVTILTKEGCRADSRTIIRVDRDIDIYAPNIIWPEDPDSDNSAFTLFTRPGSVRQILSLQVYDRWGEQMYVNKNFLPDDRTLGWTGDFKGEPMNPGVFVWWAEVELIDGQVILLKGDVTVVR